MIGPPPPAAGRGGRWVRLGAAGVDSATLGIVDPVYAGDLKCPMPDGIGIADQVRWSAHGGEVGCGVQFWAGFGDGSYDVWAWIVDYGDDDLGDERVAQIVVTFIDQDRLDEWEAG